MGQNGAVANAECTTQIKAFFANPEATGYKLAADFLRQKTCADAVSVWIAASQFLKAKFPDNAQARLLSDRLLTRAKRTYISYVETSAFEETQPICTLGADTMSLECRDRQSGAALL
jgi:hypothetical protein